MNADDKELLSQNRIESEVQVLSSEPPIPVVGLSRLLRLIMKCFYGTITFANCQLQLIAYNRAYTRVASQCLAFN